MDAKILKAAVSAAIRVTVSTTLIGCGGQMSTDAGAAGAPGAAGHVGSNGQSAKGSDTPANVDYPYGEPASSGNAATGGGAPVGGMASQGGTASTAEAGSAGEASAGEPLDSCACKALLASVKEGDVLSSEAKLCCQAMFADWLKPPTTNDQCSSQLDWFSSAAHGQCCTVLDAWQQSACTPWGPPVPPELPFEALLEWQAAA